MRLVEDHLFLIIIKMKHLDVEASAIKWPEMLPTYNFILQWLVRKYVQIIQIRNIKCTSTGDLTEEELREEALRDIRAVAGQLKSGSFIASNRLTIWDFSIAAPTASILYWRIKIWLTSFCRELEIFDQYLQRVTEAVGGFDYEIQEPNLGST